MRKKIIAANWKMNMTQGEAANFVATFLLELGESTEVEVVIVPPFTAIAAVNGALGQAQHIKVGAQNMHWERSGAFTGEISPAMLRDLFVRYVVLGHSERRTLFGETDEIVNRKVRAAHEAMLRPIVCVGETLEQRERGDVEKVLGTQLRGSLAGLEREGIAGDGDCLRAGLGDRHRQDRDGRSRRRKRTPSSAGRSREISDEATADKIRIQYGGSVKPDNARTLMSQPDIDGALVGGASLDPRSFAQIVQGAARSSALTNLSFRAAQTVEGPRSSSG